MKGSRRGWPGGHVQAAGLAKTEPEIAGQQRRDPGCASLLSLAPTWPPRVIPPNLAFGLANDNLYQTLDHLAQILLLVTQAPPVVVNL